MPIKNFLKLTGILTLLGQGLLWAIPGAINLQGRLTDDKGTPITEPRQVEFSIYQGGGTETPDTGRLVYKERAVVLPNAEGLYNHVIGEGTPLDGQVLAIDDFLNDEPVFLQLGIQGTALLPRLRFLSESFSFVSGLAESVKNGAVTREGLNRSSFETPGVGLVPPGAILLFVDRTSCPNGFREVQSLRNRLPIGADLADIDNLVPNNVGATAGSKTHEHDISHTHSISNPSSFSNYQSVVFGQMEDAPGFDVPKLIKTVTISDGLIRLQAYNHTHTTQNQSVGRTNPLEYLPPSLTVLFCAKE